MRNTLVTTCLTYLVFLFSFASPVFSQQPVIRLGILGDSNTDEYRADDNRGRNYLNGAFTFNWLEVLVNHRGIDSGVWSNNSRGEPRRRGYEFNWSRSAATAASLLSSGQHTGLAQQVRENRVTHALIWIGTNDFSPNPAVATYDPIYNGSMSDSQLNTKINNFRSNVILAVDTVLAAKNIPLIIVGVGDPAGYQLMQTRYPSASGRARATNAINTVNQHLRTIAQERNLAFVDLNVFGPAYWGGSVWVVDGVSINLQVLNDDPHYMLLSDMHVGTVANTIYANKLFIEPMNSHYGTSIPLFTNNDALVFSGIRAASTPTPIISVTPAPIPGDANADGKVDGVDYIRWLNNYGTTTSSSQPKPSISMGNFNNDATVDGVDYIIWLNNYGV